MKFLVDMPLSPVLARWLVDQGHDAVHAAEIGMQTAPDTAIIERAKQEARTLMTADLDYPRLLALTAARAPSLILFRGGNWSEAEVVARIEHLLETSPAVDIESSVFVIERNRVRRRRLPIRE